MRNGHIKRITDDDIASSVLEIVSANVSTTYVTCPSDPQKTLGIKLPFLVMIIKNLKKYFSFEVQVLDDKNVRRRFRASNYQVTTICLPYDGSTGCSGMLSSLSFCICFALSAPNNLAERARQGPRRGSLPELSCTSWESECHFYLP